MSRMYARYDDEFKMNAVKASYARKGTMAETAKDQGVSVSALYNWRKKYMVNVCGTQQTKQKEMYVKINVPFDQMEIIIEVLTCFEGSQQVNGMLQ